MKSFYSLSILFFVLVSCNTTTTKQKAIIIERRKIDDKMMQVKYSFFKNDIKIIDSQIVANTALLPHDTIDIDLKNNTVTLHY